MAQGRFDDAEGVLQESLDKVGVVRVCRVCGARVRHYSMFVLLMLQCTSYGEVCFVCTIHTL